MTPPPVPIRPPRFSTKVAARAMNLPASDIANLVRDHKYPTEPSARGRTHYYHHARLVLRELAQGNWASQDPILTKLEELEQKLAQVQQEQPVSKQAEAKLRHNIRVLKALKTTSRDQSGTIATENPGTWSRTEDGVQVRFTPDLVLDSPKGRRFILVNYSADAVDIELLRRTLELSFWVLGTEGSMRSLEYWCLDGSGILRWTKHRKRTIKKFKDSLPVIASAWDRVPPPRSLLVRTGAIA